MLRACYAPLSLALVERWEGMSNINRFLTVELGNCAYRHRLVVIAVNTRVGHMPFRWQVGTSAIDLATSLHPDIWTRR